MRRRIVVGLALAVAVAGGVAAYLFLRGLEMPEAPLDAVPKGAYAVVYVDVPAVLDSSWYADYARPSAVGRAIAQLARHLRGTGRWWLLPMVGVLLVAALLVGIVAVVEVAAPFVYSLF